MRHGKRFNHLRRKEGHRKATLANLASELILQKRIKTTLPKAKALRKYIEPLITRAKNDSTHSRRLVFKRLNQKKPVRELFLTVADKIANRPGGYTRILKLGGRLGDNAELALIELVDFNEHLLEEKKKEGGKGRRRRRTRRGGGKTKPQRTVPQQTEEKKEQQETSETQDQEPKEE